MGNIPVYVLRFSLEDRKKKQNSEAFLITERLYEAKMDNTIKKVDILSLNFLNIFAKIFVLDA